MRLHTLTDVNVYSDCDRRSTILGTAPINFISDYDEEVNGWYRIKNCWLSTLDSNEKYVIKQTNDEPKGEIHFFSLDLQLFGLMDKVKDKVTESAGTVTDSVKDGYGGAKDSIKKKIDQIRGLTISDIWKAVTKEASGVGDYIKESVNGFLDLEEYQGINLTKIGGLMGMPYQFLPWIDSRLDETGDMSSNFSSFGRKYAEKIAIRTPMLTMAPGDPLFLGGANKKEVEGLLNSLADDVKSIGQEVTSDPAKYYGFQLANTEYQHYVNSLCYAAAVNMNLAHKDFRWFSGTDKGKFMGQPIFDPLKNTTDTNLFVDYTKKWGHRGAVAFYVNSDTQISESIANSTTPSMLAESINQVSNMAREVQFLLGSSGGVAGKALNNIKDSTSDIGSKGGAIDTVTSAIAGSGSLINTISKSMGNIMAGGKMIFPEIWSDSQFSRDYQVSLKFVSPDNDDLSLYHNIIVPSMHLLAFALPRGSSTNSYVAPFLVRAAYKSFFSIDMGIVTSMSITKGAEGCWNRHGIPTSVEVQIGFKELYGIMNMAMYNIAGIMSSSYNIQQNDMLLTYIANMCGVNLIMSDVSRNIIQQWKLTQGGAVDKAMAIDDAIGDWAGTKISNIGAFFQK